MIKIGAIADSPKNRLGGKDSSQNRNEIEETINNGKAISGYFEIIRGVNECGVEEDVVAGVSARN